MANSSVQCTIEQHEVEAQPLTARPPLTTTSTLVMAVTEVLCAAVAPSGKNHSFHTGFCHLASSVPDRHMNPPPLPVMPSMSEPLKVHLVALGKAFQSEQKDVQWQTKVNKQSDLKGQHNFNRYTLFICGGPCHLSSFEQCSGDLTFLWEQLAEF